MFGIQKFHFRMWNYWLQIEAPRRPVLIRFWDFWMKCIRYYFILQIDYLELSSAMTIFLNNTRVLLIEKSTRALWFLKNVNILNGHFASSALHMPYWKLTFSFTKTSDEASGGTEGQTAGLGQGSMLSEALLERKRIKLKVRFQTFLIPKGRRKVI